MLGGSKDCKITGPCHKVGVQPRCFKSARLTNENGEEDNFCMSDKNCIYQKIVKTSDGKDVCLCRR